LMDPVNADVPTDPATLYALCGALARKASDSNVDRFITYANRLPDEFSVMMVTNAIKMRPALQSTRGFIAWASKHSSVLI
jgi:hypothetical protein